MYYIVMSDWKNLFTNTLLTCGKALYDNGSVMNLASLGNIDGSKLVAATVLDDPDIYNTAVTLSKDNELLRADCTCQYHKKAVYCKHVAALLYSISKDETDVDKEEKEKKEAAKKKKYSPVVFNDDGKPHFLSFKDTLNLYMPTSETLKKAYKIVENRTLYSMNITTVESPERYISYSISVKDENDNNRSVTIKLGRNGIIAINCENRYGWYSSRDIKPDQLCRNTSPNEDGVYELCVHKTAALISLARFIEEHRDYLDYTDKKAEILIESFKKEKVVVDDKKSSIEKYPVDIETSIGTDFDNGGLKAEIRVSVDGGKFYKIKDVVKLLSARREKSTLSLSTLASVDFSRAELTERAEAALKLIEVAENDYNRNVNNYYTKYSWKKSEIRISRFLDDFFNLMKDSVVLHGISPILAFRETESSLVVNIEPVIDKNEVVAVEVTGRITGRYSGREYIYWFEKDEFRRTPKSRLGSAQSLMNTADDSGRFSFTVGRKYLDNFYQRVVPDLKRHGRVEDNAVDMLSGILKEAPKTILYIYDDNERITCRAVMQYEGNTLTVYPSYYSTFNRGHYQSYLNDIAETLDSFFNKRIYGQEKWLAASTDDEIYDFIQNKLPLLMEMGEVKVSDRIKNMIVRRMPSVSSFVEIDENDDSVLNFTLDMKGMTVEELVEILKSYKNKKKFHRLKNGDFISLEDTSLNALCDIFLSSGLSIKDFTNGRMHLPLYRALYLDQILKEQNDVSYEGGQKLRRLIKEFKTIEESDYEVPSSLNETMRSYQKDGYRWMRVLFDHGFGGILADDMGLGKTLQALSLLLALKEEKKSVNALIVSPASLVYNWKAEVSKFTPTLNAVTVTGTTKERENIIKNRADYDILITSYDLLKRDIALYSDAKFTLEIIDEAQFIKNHSTAAAKAVRAVKASHRLALTGTPIENRLSELWSIFEYLMPGFLFSQESFKKLLSTPIEKNGDKDAAARLKKLTGPFILRRLKTDVLKDLPEKTEETRVTPLEGEQLKLYTAEVAKAKGMLKGSENYNEKKIEILAELMKIREICCDPSLVFADYKGESAKREAVMDLITSAIDGGHRILLFSQFTSMLELLEKDLEERGIEYYKITGETGKAKRLELVDAFNSGFVPIFLISLKAGGTGLNLTAADIVIHYDPWWNTAVQNQATDRAHRIGQTKRVTVYRMIAENTIEEKIMKLQETKKNLADEIVSSDNISLSTLSKEDLMELLTISNMG